MQQFSFELARVLHRVAQGEHQAFSELYNATSLKLFGIIFRIIKQRELAEEILQEVYCKIWENASAFDASKASPITWMAAIARNRALDEVRRRQPQFSSDESGILEIVDSGKSPSDQLEISDELRRLENCFEGLDEERRAAIKLAYLDGFSRKELADKFDQPIGTIKTWLHRGLKQLRDCLGA